VGLWRAADVSGTGERRLRCSEEAWFSWVAGGQVVDVAVMAGGEGSGQEILKGWIWGT
jgi:hypothetical protein